MACVPDRDSAMRELAQAYELLKSHQPRLQFGEQQQLSATTNLAQSLLNKALQALHLALCVMNPETSAHCGAERSSRSNDMPHLFSPSAAAGGDVGGTMSQQKKGKRRRANDETSRIILTAAPHDDGYVWRKYGEKKINGTHFKRNYFRCSYKYDRGCQAIKQIQQKCSTDDVPLFQVTYNSEHTCNCTTTANRHIKNDLPQQSDFNANGMISQMGDVMTSQMGDVMTSQEQGLLPPLAEVSTVILDSMSCEEPFILSDPYTLSSYHVGYHITNTDDGASDFQFGSTDGYINLEHMVLRPEPLEENPCIDADLDLLYDSFIYN